jgi:hypothetical protein
VVGPFSAATARISRAGQPPGRQHLLIADLTGRFVQGDRNAVWKRRTCPLLTGVLLGGQL